MAAPRRPVASDFLFWGGYDRSAMNRLYEGPAVAAEHIPDDLPQDLRDLLLETNGYIGMGGALHFRGVGDVPDWHSLERVWRGDEALSELYDDVAPDDVPFAQDCLGDQYLLREGRVLCLQAETGEIESLDTGIAGFVLRAMADPNKVCGAGFVARLKDEGHELAPGELINVYPPLCFEEAAGGVSLHAVPALELLAWHAELARQLATAEDGERVEIDVEPMR